MLNSTLVLVAVSLVILTYLLGKLVLQASSSDKENPYSSWAHKYGDIVHFPIPNKNVIIINSVQMAIDMQESKGSIYSDRDAIAMLKLLFGTHVAISRQQSTIEDETHRFLRHLLSSPEDLADLVRHFAGSIVLKISYGYTTKEEDDPFISSAEALIRKLSLTVSIDTLPWMVDVFPILEKLPSWFPGTNFKKLAKEWSDYLQEAIETPFQLVKKEMTVGTPVPSFTSAILADGNLSSEDERAIKLTAMTIYLAGSDTTVTSIQGFFLAMALNPDVFKKAREEIDAVVGTQRLPLISDKVNLPYISALVQEVFRWAVVVPNGTPHVTSQDDAHSGYFIPKGSIILSNIHFMMNDPRLYKDPEQFMPERFLGENPERYTRDMAFGFGRRQCSGRLLAEDTAFAVCAMSIAAFDIQKKVKNGVVIEPVRRMVSGLVAHLDPYEIDVKPRSPQAASLIRATARA